MAILKTLLCCQSLLRAGYESIQSSGPEWLRVSVILILPFANVPIV